MIRRTLYALVSLIWRLLASLVWLIWAIMRPSLRFISAVLLLAAVMLLTADVTRWQVAEPGPTFLSLGDHAQALAPTSFEGAERAISQNLHPLLWDPVGTTFLAIPAWLFFTVLAIAIAYAGREVKQINVFIN